MLDPARILFTLPMKRSDPTRVTYVWGQKAASLARELGYNVIVLEKDNANYDNLNKSIIEYDPRVIVHLGHGCKTNLQGQNGCMITRNFSIDEMISMADSPYQEDRLKLLKILNSLGSHLGETSCPGICRNNIGLDYNMSLDLDNNNDPCSDRCRKDTNVHLLKNRIVYTTACFSSDQLGRCAVAYGADAYMGYKDLFIFPADNMGSQDIFGDLQLLGLKEILVGRSLADAEYIMSEEEDRLIRKFKPVKYMSICFLWNKLNREFLGNRDLKDITVY